jgi:hypothetical protein
VPNLNYKSKHNFQGLETGGLLSTFQSIEFRLDRSGAALASHAYITTRQAISRTFSFTRPFFDLHANVWMYRTYFVMWIDNGELICKPG